MAIPRHICNLSLPCDCAASSQEEAKLASQLPAAAPSMWQVKALAFIMSCLVTSAARIGSLLLRCTLCWRSSRACWARSAHVKQVCGITGRACCYSQQMAEACAMCGMYVAPQIVMLLPSCSIVVCKHPVIDWARRTQLPCPLGCALSASPPRCLQGMLSLVGLPKIQSASKLCHLVSAASVDAAMYQHSPACCLQRLLPNKHPHLIRYCVLLITIPLLPAECPVCGGPVTVPYAALSCTSTSPRLLPAEGTVRCRPV